MALIRPSGDVLLVMALIGLIRPSGDVHDSAIRNVFRAAVRRGRRVTGA